MSEQIISLKLSQYAALVSLARKGIEDASYLEEFLQEIEKQNLITRYFLAVRWQETNTPLPPNIREKFPAQWPPTQQTTLTRFDRPISKVDVEAEVKRLANNPVGVMVTKDPNEILGWTKIDDWFIT